MRVSGWLALCFASLSSGCGQATPEAVGSHHHVARTSGGAVALSYDERIAVVTNRAAGVVTVLSLKPERGPADAIVKTSVLDVGSDAEPWAAVIGADDDTAFVILRKAQRLIRIEHLRENPVVDQETVVLGSEPMGLAITPTGKLLFVANWGNGTVTTVDIQDFRFISELDLNEKLVETGALGEVASRAALAHPRAVTVTDDGDQDDEDETLYATEFFSQPSLAAKGDPAAVDSDREGIVYSISVESGQRGVPIPISPVSATGFADSDGKMTSCFPNQLSAAAAVVNRLYVTAMCTSPRGPLDKQGDSTANFKTLFHPAVFAIDTTRDPATGERVNQEVPSEGRLLTQVLQAAYDTDAAAGKSEEVRMPLIPNDLAFGTTTKAGYSGYVLALGADALFRLSYDAKGVLSDIGTPKHRFVTLPYEGYPIGLSVSRRSEKPFALVLSDVAQHISVVDLALAEIAESVPAAPDNPRAQALRDSPQERGRAIFATGLGPWSYQGAGWSSCESCHPGGLSDGVTWYFARGPRRTLSAANTYEKNKDNPGRRLLLWGANVDEIHDVEAIVRSVSGGMGAMIWRYPTDANPSNDCRLVYDGKPPPAAKPGGEFCTTGAKATSYLLNGLNGSLAALTKHGGGCRPDLTPCDDTARTDWNDIDAFIRSLRVPRAPTNLDPAAVAAGRKVFSTAGCGNCHGGPQWTVSTLFYEPSLAANGAAPSAPPLEAPPLGKLRESVYQVPLALAPLNPAARDSGRTDCADGYSCATYREPAGETAAAQLAVIYGDPTKPRAEAAAAAAKAAGEDQLRCALRDVGTFPSQATTAGPGIAPTTGIAAWEVRQDMTTVAQGKAGFSVPSLFGLATGAPFFHAGNARSLEELFDDNFSRHHQSMSASFLSTRAADEDKSRAEEVKNMVQFLLSIDDTTPPADVPTGYDFCKGTP